MKKIAFLEFLVTAAIRIPEECNVATLRRVSQDQI